jgi:radical SAM protein with 4Fe4S-binding SPASM domain
MILKFCAETPLVKGFNRSCIYDLPRKKYDFVPNEVLSKIIELEDNHQETIETLLDEDEKSWLDFLIENEYAFYFPELFKDCFPKIDFTWKNPSPITNAIIDIEDFESPIEFKIFEDLNCKHLVIRFQNIENIDFIFTFLEERLKDLTFKSVDIIIEKNATIPVKQYTFLKKKLVKEITLISSVVVSKREMVTKTKRFRPNFIVEIKTFSEAQKHNLFFNRKLYIDSKGLIRNGVESHQQFSSITEDKSIKKTVSSSRFQKLWKINKDEIEVCKDCEFRYMCLDNRIPKKRKDGTFFQETECAYNPYVSLWDTDEEFLSLEEIGVKSDINGFSHDNEKIRSINQVLWDEK